MADMTSSNSNVQNPRKTYKVYILEIICAKFHQNRFSRLDCSADTHRHTNAHTHTHTYTHPRLDRNIFSHFLVFPLFFSKLCSHHFVRNIIIQIKNKNKGILMILSLYEWKLYSVNNGEQKCLKEKKQVASEQKYIKRDIKCLIRINNKSWHFWD